MDWIKNLVIAAKRKFMYQEDAERVDIRVDSVADWLYKITIKRPDDVKDKAYEKKKDIQAILNEIGILADKIEVHQILDKTVSKYKKESIQSNKEKYITRIRNIVSKGDKETTSIEGYRKYFKNIEQQIEVDKSALEAYNRRIEEYFGKETAAIRQKLLQLQNSINIFKHEFQLSNDQKVEQIISKIKTLNDSEESLKEGMKEVEQFDREIDGLREHVYKLGERITKIRQSTRFKDIISKESKLGEVLEQTDSIYDNLAQELHRIEIPLFQFASKANEEGLVKEYLSHIEHAIEHDKEHKILTLLEGLLADLNNKRTKIRQSLSDEKAENYIVLTEKILKSLPENIESITGLKKQALLARRAVRSHVILSELEDIESRKAFYQKKLVAKSIERRKQLESLDSLHLSAQKDKIKKELLLLTGYDVNVIYDEK